MIAAGAARRMNGENFPVALRALPRAVRDDLAATYVFARFVDEIGDSAPGGPDARLALLDLVTADLDALPERATLPPVAGLARMVTEHDVPLDPFRELVEANRLDQRRSSYADLAELLGYCRLAAAPVGRIVLYRAGAADDRSIARSDDVCAALQILEHCQDVGEDARAGRVYLPQDSLAAERVAPERLRGGITPPGLRRVVAEQVARSRELLRSGPPLVRGLHGWARLAVAGYVAGGLATADALDAADHDVLAVAVRPSTARTLRHALRLLAGRPGRDGRSA
ncbi:squalene synthase HpnC [Jatrophihabitans endophyticus]|nr:squalene synthase HpnC [Jatrophihabitans endophyticus]